MFIFYLILIMKSCNPYYKEQCVTWNPNSLDRYYNNVVP